jgi:hypothetical protein
MDSTAVIGERTKPSPKAFLPWIAVFVLGVGVGGLLCWLLLVQPSEQLIKKSLVLKPAGDARVTMILLEKLHEGDTQRVINLLQTLLEGNIVSLGDSSGAVDSSVKNDLDPESAAYIEETLKRAAVYFGKYPRTAQTDPAFAWSERALAKTLASVSSKEGGQNAP